MKVGNINPNNEEVNWKYFPIIYQLSQYLPRSDLIQLSLTCSQFRDKLNSEIFKKLELMRGCELIPANRNKSTEKKELTSLFGILEEDYLEKYNIVKHCIIWDFTNSRLAGNFSSLFANITQLELYSKYTYNYPDILSNSINISSNSNLIEILYPLKNLESLKVCNELIDKYESYSKLFIKLPLSLKMLFVVQHKYLIRDLSFYPIENINEEYSNLKKVSIFNSKMLSSMTTRMKSLTDVTISNQDNLSTSSLVQFLLHNPQLEKLSVPVFFLDYELIDSILRMNQLKQLNMNYSLYGKHDVLDNLSVNTSIEHLNIRCYISRYRLMSILNSLKSLKVLEFSNCSLYNFTKLNFSACTSRIPLLHLNSLDFEEYEISTFNNPKIFDKVRLTNMFDLDCYLTNYKGDDLESWDVCNLDPVNSREFTLIKKT